MSQLFQPSRKCAADLTCTDDSNFHGGSFHNRNELQTKRLNLVRVAAVLTTRPASPASTEQLPGGRLADTGNPYRAIRRGFHSVRSTPRRQSQSNKRYSLRSRRPFLPHGHSTNGRRLRES